MQLNELKIPGKVILSGEYAVLYGGTAVVAPAERFISVSETEPNNGDHSTPIITAALDYPLKEVDGFESDRGKPGIDLNSADFFTSDNGSRRKLGIGLSAAEAVAVVELRMRRAGLNGSDLCRQVAEYAHYIHHHTQGGIGSGADIFCCAYRRPIIYKNDHGEPRVLNEQNGKREITVPVRMVWSGIVSDTRQMIHRYNDWLENGGETAKDCHERMTAIGEKIAPLWFGNADGTFYEIFDEYIEVMNECASKAKLDYWLDCHTELDKWARKYGGRAKPSGAGGGDMIILVGDLPVEKLNREVFKIKCQA